MRVNAGTARLRLIAVQDAATAKVVIPAKAGIHIPETAACGTMGPRFRGDDTTENAGKADYIGAWMLLSRTTWPQRAISLLSSARAAAGERCTCG